MSKIKGHQVKTFNPGSFKTASACCAENLFEMLWKKIKYEWLPMDIYGSFKTMSEGLFEVLKGIGSKYRITFV